MGYREEFTEKVRKIFETETAAYRRKQKAYDFITEYFGDLFDDLYDETEAVEDKLEIDYEKLRFGDKELQIEVGKRSIEIYTIDQKSEDRLTIDWLEDDGNTYVSKKYGKALGDEILDQYLEDAFAKALG